MCVSGKAKTRERERAERGLVFNVPGTYMYTLIMRVDLQVDSTKFGESNKVQVYEVLHTLLQRVHVQGAPFDVCVSVEERDQESHIFKKLHIRQGIRTHIRALSICLT